MTDQITDAPDDDSAFDCERMDRLGAAIVQAINESDLDHEGEILSTLVNVIGSILVDIGCPTRRDLCGRAVKLHLKDVVRDVAAQSSERDAERPRAKGSRRLH
jgi:hypothetical protein